MMEVALALAIIGIAMVSILGLLAVGLNTARDATDDNLAAQLVQAIVADRQSVPYAQATPSINDEVTCFNVPALSSFSPNPYVLYFPKSGTKPSTALASDSYFQIQIRKAAGLAPDFSDLAILDFQVAWPARAPDANKTTLYYTTAIGQK
ncbi:MAG: hypothetical protein IT578_07580 [Verrucomicrobiae bacterium]|nr:hypothetical protein [Verrucomicrobiae bacterium]